jgi:hypothetical protein
MDAIREVGALAGLAAFIGLAVLSLLYFAQARDVRRLRENAEFLIEGPEGDTAAPQVPPPIGAEEEATQGRATPPPTDAEAFRRAELARQAADRRQRFEQRRSGEGGSLGDRLSNVPSTVVITIGALILIAGIAFGATRLLGGDESSTGAGGGNKSNLACKPGDTQIAVLNGTGEQGLAGESASKLKQKGYKVTPITNTISPFDTSTIQFGQGGQDCVAEIAPVVGIPGNGEPMNQEIQGISEGAQLAVILGEDRVTGATSTDSSTTATDSSTLGD